ncbi:hypothetical protein ACWC0C_40370 [Streptomyces sp. NPDC001709]
MPRDSLRQGLRVVVRPAAVRVPPGEYDRGGALLPGDWRMDWLTDRQMDRQKDWRL